MVPTTQYDSLLTHNRFRLTIVLMRGAGIPIFMEKRSMLYSLYVVASYICTLGTLAASWLDVTVGKHDLKEVLAALRMSIGLLVPIWVNICFRIQMKSLEGLLRFTEIFTWEEMPKKDPETGQLTSAGCLPLIEKVVKYVLAANVTTHVLQCTYRILANHDTTLQTWYPYDFKVSPAYELTNLSQILSTIQLVCSFYSFLGLFSSAVIVGYSQFDKLKTNLMDVKGKSSSSNYNAKWLNGCIVHHQKILEYLDEMENSLNICICGVVFLQMTSCCISAFSATISWGDYADMSESLLIYVVLMGSICCVCWAGEELTQMAESIRDSAYDSDWIGTPISFQRSIMLIITRTNNTFYLTAGKFVPVSNETMMNILKQTLSLFMFLLEMKDKNTNHHQ